MKRILALILVLVMVFALAACGSKKEEGKAEEAAAAAPAGAEPAAEEAAGQGEEPTAAIANPWVECDMDALEGYVGWRFGIPEGATNAVFRWNQSIGMAEMIYTVDGTEWTARIQKTDEFTDISGMYYEFDENSDNYGWGTENPIKDYDGDEYMGKQYLLETEEGTVNLAMWYYEMEGYMFSLGCVSTEGILLFNDRYIVFFPENCNTDA